MKKNLLKNSWFVAVFLILIFLVLPLPARADMTAELVFKALNWFFYQINLLIGWLGGVLFSLAGMLVGIAFETNAHIISDANPIVFIGWNISRDLANLGFVLVIIIIAFATILRIQDYGINKLLPKLILAAVLVNFSLLIGKVFVDFSNVLTDFFLKNAEVSPSTVATALADAFRINKLLSASLSPDVPIPPPDFGQVSEALFVGIASVIFTFLFTVLGAICLFILAILFLLRFLWLSFLLMISPFAWLLGLIPNFSEHSKKWWENFTHWVFLGPAAGFFVYLAIASAQKLKDVQFVSIQSNKFLGLAGPLETIFAVGANMSLILGILVGGLIAAQKLGAKFAGSGVNWISNQGKAVQGKATAWGKTRAASLRDRALTVGTDEQGKTALERVGGRLKTVPLVGRMFTGVSGVSTKAKERLSKGAQKEYEKDKDRTAEDLIAMANRQSAIASPQELSGLGLAIAEKKDAWDKLDPVTQQRILKALKQTNSFEEFLKHHPEYAKFFNKDIKQAIKNAPNISHLNKETLGSEDFAPYLTAEHLSQLNYDSEKKKAVVNTLTNVLGGQEVVNKIRGYKKALEQKQKEIQQAKDENDIEAVKSLYQEKQKIENELKQAMADINKDAKKRDAWKTYETASEMIHWQEKDIIPPV